MMADETMDDLVFKALSAPVRRRLLDLLRVGPATTGRLCAAAPDLDRTTVLQHLKVLQRAELVVSVKRGRETVNHLNALPIRRIHQRWIGPVAASAIGVLDALDQTP